MEYKNDTILLRIHIVDYLSKLLGNISSVKPNFNNVTPVRLLELPINTHFLSTRNDWQLFIENYPEDIYLL